MKAEEVQCVTKPKSLKKKKSKKEKKSKKDKKKRGGDDTLVVHDEQSSSRKLVKKRKLLDGSDLDVHVKRNRDECDGNDVKSAAGKEAKKKAKKNKRKKEEKDNDQLNTTTSGGITNIPQNQNHKPITFPIKYILAPMVGASELPFRLLCRKYGAQTAYTPMMNSHKFATDAQYRDEEFQTIPEDRPLVCHFSSNDPKDFVAAAKIVQDKCDAVDLNLGCPQRTAYLGHFGSYLLGQKDRDLICSIVREASKELSIPVFVKIRLLDTIEDTIELCQQLKNAGASLIAIHARYRSSFERKGPGARDGPAMLDQILKVRDALGNDYPLIANGNIITYDDVENNLNFTRAHGVMSAEGILDLPSLYLPQYGDIHNIDDKGKLVDVAKPSPLLQTSSTNGSTSSNVKSHDEQFKKKRKLAKKIREIEKLEAKKNQSSLSKEERNKITLKESLLKQLQEIEQMEMCNSDIKAAEISSECDNAAMNTTLPDPSYEKVPLAELHKLSEDKLSIASEYLNLTRKYPTKLRTIVFHTRRMLKELLNEYQLMEECINSKSIDEIEAVINKIRKYQNDPSSFHYDKEKEKRDKEALERKRREEGKRKAYEARMIRKAKREGKEDSEFYLRQGSEVPKTAEILRLRKLSKEKQMECWKAGNHSQHCMAFHLSSCMRGRSCAFLHVDALGENSFLEMDEVAG